MKWFSKAAVGGLLWLGFSAFAFGDTLFITGQSENVDQGGQFTAYLGSNPSQQLLIYCIDYRNYDASGVAVNISDPNELVPSSVANTRYGTTPTASFSFYNSGPNALSAVQRYVLAAYLTTQYTFTSGVTTADLQIQNAIWSLLDVDGTTSFPGPSGGIGTGSYITQAINWQNAQTPASLLAFENEIRVYTSTNIASVAIPGRYTTGTQEMIGVVTPEPATLAMMGAGLLALGLFRKRIKA